MSDLKKLKSWEIPKAEVLLKQVAPRVEYILEYNTAVPLAVRDMNRFVESPVNACYIAICIQ